MSEKIRLTALEKSRLPEPDRQNVVRFCPKCGREIPLDRNTCFFCENTGAIAHPKQPFGRKILTMVLIISSLLILFTVALFLTRNSGLRPAVTEPVPTAAVRGTVVPVILLP